MSKVLQRMKGILNKKPNRTRPSGPPPNRQGNQAPIGTITKPPSPTDDDDDDAASVGNYNVPEQTQLKERNTMNPQRNNAPPERNNAPPAPQRNNAPPERSNNPPAPQRNNAPPERNNTQAVTPAPQRNNAPPERNNAPPERNNAPPAPQRNNAPPERNNNPSSILAPPSLPNITNNPSGTNTNQATSPMNSFFSGMNVNSTSPPSPSTINNSQSPSAGFPSSFNTNRSPTNDYNNSMDTKKPTSLSQRATSFRIPQQDDDTLSRLELDYPIENVLIDANIPSAIAVKINDAVEQDRHGNNYHVHRYTYEPSSQQISYDNHNQYQPPHHNDQNSRNKNHRGGTRHIREIHHNNQNPQYNDLTTSHYNHHHHSRTPQNRHRHRSHSEVPLDQYIDQLLHTPGSTVIHAQNSNDLQQIFGQYQPNNLSVPTQSSLSPLQSKNIPFPEPIVYYTAQALPNDPMRSY